MLSTYRKIGNFDVFAHHEITEASKERNIGIDLNAKLAGEVKTSITRTDLGLVEIWKAETTITDPYNVVTQPETRYRLRQKTNMLCLPAPQRPQEDTNTACAEAALCAGPQD